MTLVECMNLTKSYNKGINARVEFWGYDVDHDWDWWYKQCDHYVPQLIY